MGLFVIFYIVWLLRLCACRDFSTIRDICMEEKESLLLMAESRNKRHHWPSDGILFSLETAPTSKNIVKYCILYCKNLHFCVFPFSFCRLKKLRFVFASLHWAAFILLLQKLLFLWKQLWKQLLLLPFLKTMHELFTLKRVLKWIYIIKYFKQLPSAIAYIHLTAFSPLPEKLNYRFGVEYDLGLIHAILTA